MEPFQPSIEIVFKRLDHQMVMIAHQAIDIAAPLLLHNLPPEQLKEMPPIGVIHEDHLLGVAPSGEVVDGPGEFEAEVDGSAKHFSKVSEH